MKDSLKVAIVGATGYIGLELIKILLKHKKVEILYLCATKNIGKSIHSIDQKIKNKKLPKISKFNKINFKRINVIFTALPNGEAQKIAKSMPHNIKLIDLSADFRLNNYKLYEKWYGIKHNCKSLTKKSLYSISEFSKKNLKNTQIISCPGCYPTSVQIPLIPIIEKKMILTDNIIIDSKSGYSGAGKNVRKKFNFKNLFESVSAYGVASHRHTAEIDQELSRVANKKITVIFTPHLIPMFRGILSTIYLKVRGKNTARKIHTFLKNYHKNNFFVKVAKFNSHIGTGDVMKTNYCIISVCEDRIKKRIIILSAIDNLIKGGSGQAVQNMNIAYNFNEKFGLV